MRAGTRVCAAIFAALATLSTAGCTISNAIADAGHQPSPAPTTEAAKPKPSPTPSKTMKSLPAGTRQLSVDGRSFLLYVPPRPRQPAPLVVFLGGIGSTAKSELSIFRGTAVAKRSGAVVAYPSPSTSNGTWNAGGCCWGAKTNDVAYLSHMRNRIASLVTLDPARQVIIGYSNGGMLAYDAACADRHWTEIVAFGASLTTRCQPTHTFTITNVNGELDTVAPWNGGWSGYARANMPPVWKIDQEFAAVFRCRGPSHTKSGQDVVYTYIGCSGGVYVRDIRVPGLRHHWPLKEVDGYDMGPALWRLAGI